MKSLKAKFIPISGSTNKEYNLSVEVTHTKKVLWSKRRLSESCYFLKSLKGKVIPISGSTKEGYNPSFELMHTRKVSRTVKFDS